MLRREQRSNFMSTFGYLVFSIIYLDYSKGTIPYTFNGHDLQYSQPRTKPTNLRPPTPNQPPHRLDRQARSSTQRQRHHAHPSSPPFSSTRPPHEDTRHTRLHRPRHPDTNLPNPLLRLCHSLQPRIHHTTSPNPLHLPQV